MAPWAGYQDSYEENRMAAQNPHLVSKVRANPEAGRISFSFIPLFISPSIRLFYFILF